MPLQRRLAAEFLGTLWLVLGGCGAAVITANFPKGGIGMLGVAFAFGHVSGAHLNPAVTLGLWAGRRFESRSVLPYIVIQVVGGIAGAAIVLVIANGHPGYSLSRQGLAANGYGAHSPGGYDVAACLVAEVVMTAVFLFVIMGVTDRRAPRGFAPAAIGLALTLIHLITIPVTNTSVNPARSTGPAVLMGSWAVRQLWMFWVAPIVGAILAGLCYRYIAGEVGVPEVEEIGAEPGTVAREVPVGEGDATTAARPTRVT